VNRTIPVLLAVIACVASAGAGGPRPSIPPDHFLQGYVEAVSGEVLSYWNFHPFAKQSLLTRCTTGEMAIIWQTQLLPSASTIDTLSFLWIGAFSTGTSSADHDFDLSVNGEKILTFRTFGGGIYDDWLVSGARGVSLGYRHVWTDHVGDAHGYFVLRVPAPLYPAGDPLTLKVVGRGAGSRDWYMTFMYTVRDSALVRRLPMLLRRSAELRQPIEVSVDMPADQGTVSIAIDGVPAVEQKLRLGWNPVMLSVPAVEREREVSLAISINGGPVLNRVALIKPVKHRTIWLLPHSHNDIGYSDLQTTVLDIQIQNIRDALRLIEKTRDYPEGSRFKWNIEILWPVDAFLARASPEERADFLRAVRRGDIGLNALYVNPLTGIARPEALIRLTDFARELALAYGLTIPAAMVSDIPGFIWSIVPALAQGGVRYFTSGPNAGDRIGHFATAWGDKPFYWVGPSGRDSVLFWVAGTGYSLFHGTRGFSTNTRFLQQLQGYLEHLDRMDYPYDIVQMRYSIYSDNGMTDSTMSDFVRDWSATYASPTLRIATAEEMCVAFESQYGSQLPSFAGDITPYWEDGAASTAAELGIAQRATERLVQAEIVTTMVAPEEFDPKAFADAWDAVNLWIEHTWGAWNSVSEPDHPDAVAQWKIKQGFARDAEVRSQELLRRRTASLGTAGSPVVEVINTSTWPRTDLVILSIEEGGAAGRIVDEEGQPVPSQRLTDGRLAFLAQSVPALAASRYTLEAGPGLRIGSVAVTAWTLQNQFLQVVMDSATGGVRSIRDLSTGRELVSEERVNSFVVVEGKDPHARAGAKAVRLRIGETGPLIASIVTESEAPGVDGVMREVFLIDGLKRVDVHNVIDKEAVREKEALYFGFGFNIPDAVTRLDLGWGYIRPERDQLPGSCKDFFSVQRWVDLSNTQDGITWATVEAPLISLGGLVDERHHNDGPGGWKTTASSSSLLYSWVMNNYWHTNYKAEQQGRSSFHYSFRPHETFNPVEAYRFGVERNQPLIVRHVFPDAKPTTLPFTFRSSSAVITSLTTAAAGRGLILRLYNPSAAQSSCALVPSARGQIGVFESSAGGERGRPIPQPFDLGPFELRTVRIE
jgi:alpha-mannosidase